MTITEITEKYSAKIDRFDIMIIISHVLRKPKEFILAHPEFKTTSRQSTAITKLLARRLQHEPISHLFGHKEFYGLDFVVNKHTLIPRPETEMMVEQAIHEACNIQHETKSTYCIIDIGTGSGCIIVSIAHELEKDTKHKIQDTKYYGIDISAEALKIARKNARANGVDKKIKLLQGDLLKPFLDPKSQELKTKNLIITANLPYLSKEVYQSAPIDVKKFEPKSALYSPEAGLQHYRELLEQLKEFLTSCVMLHVSCFMEISPEQKQPLTKLIKLILPEVKIEFTKDLANKWRLCKITL